VPDDDLGEVDPFLAKALSASSPLCAVALVWQVMGTPVSRSVCATAFTTRCTPGVRPFCSTTHLRNAAFTPVSAIPSRMSRMNRSAISSGPSRMVPGLRYSKWCGSSSKVYRPVAAMMFSSGTASAIRCTRGM